MKYNFTLTPEQQDLVERNLEVIDRTISRFIRINEGVCGLGREDLYQEGTLALCKAAATYDGTSAAFGTYAMTLIRNHLLDQCRAASARQRNLPSISLDAESEDGSPSGPEPSVEDATDTLIDCLDTSKLLSDCKRRYTGVARLGVEALELKINGFSGADIARLYDTKPNNVGAWISRAAQKIRKDFPLRVENTGAHS